MKRSGFRSVKQRFIFWFLTISILPLLISVVAVMYYFSDHIRQSEMNKLLAIRDLKTNQINSWLQEREGDAKTISEAPLLQILSQKSYLKRGSIAPDKVEARLLRLYLENWISNNSDFGEIYIINASDGKVILSSNPNREGLSKISDPYYLQPIKTRGTFFKDVYLSPSDHTPSIGFAVPVFMVDDPRQIISILVLRIKLENALYPLLHNRTGLGETGESILVKKDGIVLSELLHQPGAILNAKLQTHAVRESTSGITNVTETTDYRGKPIIAAYAPIELSHWGLIVKRDLDDMMQPLNNMYVFLTILTIICIILVLLFAIYIARKITKPITEMATVAQSITRGELSNRISTPGNDEFGILAETINNTADALQGKIRVQQGETEIASTMVHATDMDTFSLGLLQKLIEITGSTLGAVYLVSNDGKQLIPLNAIGVSNEALHPYDLATLEGDMGEVVLKNEILHIQVIPPDTLFNYKTFLGEVVPKELMYIPLSLGNSLHAMIVLGSLRRYTHEIRTIIDHTQVTVNTAFANLKANIRTRNLASELESRNAELTTQSMRLQAQAEELQTQSEELQHQSNELQAQNVELEVQKKQVDDANRLKSEFLSNMSHELRTPLNSIMALSRVLNTQTGEKLTPEEKNYLEIIERNGKLLLSLINDILDLSRIEAGKMDLSIREISMKEITENVVAGLKPLCNNKGITIGYSFPEELPRIQSDEKKVYQIIQNLAGNAVKFTGKGGVTITGKSTPAEIELTISDTGIGIAGKDLPGIFDEFRQVDGSSSRSYEGSGLGLAIARRLANLLGGNIYAESEPGKGSQFHLVLPIRYEGSQAATEVTALQGSIPAQTQKRTILIVDDEPAVVQLIATTLTRQGFHTVACPNSRMAVEMAEKHQPFAITLDVLMPEIDGWEVLQNLKKNQKTSHIPVIMISVSPDKDTGFALGAVGYLMKPVRPETLLREVTRLNLKERPTIMVVDDNLIERSEMAHIIRQKNFTILEAENGLQCLQMLKNQLPDLILLDLMMPIMDGFELLDRVRLDPRTRNIPVIIVTARDLSSEEKDALQGKVSSLLVKGTFDADRVLLELTTLVKTLEEKHGQPAPRILLVDDNEVVIIQVKSVLEPAGYHIDVAHGGEEALSYIKDNTPDGIVLDLMMPGVDGFMVLDAMRSTPSTEKIPVLILTAKTLTREDLSRLKANNIKQLLQKGDVDKEELLTIVRHMLLKLPEPPASQPTPGSAPSILLIEDNPDNRITVRAILGKEHQITEAHDGAAALEILKTVHPDLILLDMGLPGMDGLAVLRTIKQDPARRDIPVIALTAHAMKDDRERYLNAGCSDYLSKPFTPELLTEKIDKWIKG